MRPSAEALPFGRTIALVLLVSTGYIALTNGGAEDLPQNINDQQAEATTAADTLPAQADLQDQFDAIDEARASRSGQRTPLVAEVPAAAPSPTDTAPPPSVVVTVAPPKQEVVAETIHAPLLLEAGIAPGDYKHAEFIIQHESHWNPTADNPHSSAYGLCQALPGSKMAPAGADWKSNAITQLKWCDSYAKSRYGSWANAHAYWLKNKHW